MSWKIPGLETEPFPSYTTVEYRLESILAPDSSGTERLFYFYVQRDTTMADMMQALVDKYEKGETHA